MTQEVCEFEKYQWVGILSGESSLIADFVVSKAIIPSVNIRLSEKTFPF